MKHSFNYIQEFCLTAKHPLHDFLLGISKTGVILIQAAHLRVCGFFLFINNLVPGSADTGWIHFKQRIYKAD
ncbi:MAG TPA: hypothetical protein DCO79_13235 [Spirochaeta sp.]|nr:hypothetical protein [Spirochaeta sp.]